MKDKNKIFRLNSSTKNSKSSDNEPRISFDEETNKMKKSLKTSNAPNQISNHLIA